MTTATASEIASPVLLTAAEFTARYPDQHVELDCGVVKEVPVPFLRHGSICARISFQVQLYLQSNDIGHVMINDSWIRTRTNPDSVRGPDVIFYSYERLPRGPVPDGLLSVLPELVVEVRSPSELWTDIFSKVGEYLRAGVQTVVILDPKTETASVYRAEEFQQIFHNGDPLVIPDVLPGFSVELARLFG